MKRDWGLQSLGDTVRCQVTTVSDQWPSCWLPFVLLVRREADRLEAFLDFQHKENELINAPLIRENIGEGRRETLELQKRRKKSWRGSGSLSLYSTLWENNRKTLCLPHYLSFIWKLRPLWYFFNAIKWIIFLMLQIKESLDFLNSRTYL